MAKAGEPPRPRSFTGSLPGVHHIINPVPCSVIDPRFGSLIQKRGEGYSPSFFAQMWKEHRIACMTYHKHPGDSWPENWFTEYETVMPRGETVKMELCEMGSRIGSGKAMVWMREVRKLTESGRQTSIISTAFDINLTDIAARMFSRWCPENFFRYMMQHFDIDRVLEYGDMPFPDTERLLILFGAI